MTLACQWRRAGVLVPPHVRDHEEWDPARVEPAPVSRPRPAPGVTLRLWLAEERGDALKFVTGPRPEEGVALTVYWLPRSLVEVLAVTPHPFDDGWPSVTFRLPAWKLRRTPGLERHVVEDAA